MIGLFPAFLQIDEKQINPGAILHCSKGLDFRNLHLFKNFSKKTLL
jgi:hypothetical protein